MRCWNCDEPVSPSAKVCVRCGADLTKKPGTGDAMAVMAGLGHLDDEMIADLRSVYETSETAEEFASAILIGPCPSCGSRHVSDCDSDPETSNPIVGRCYDCGHYWCSECGRHLERPAIPCLCNPPSEAEEGEDE